LQQTTETYHDHREGRRQSEGNREPEALEGRGWPLRQGGGCAGFSYDLYFEEKLGELDEEFGRTA